MKKKRFLASLMGIVLAVTVILGAKIIAYTEKPQPEFLQIETTYLG